MVDQPSANDAAECFIDIVGIDCQPTVRASRHVSTSLSGGLGLVKSHRSSPSPRHSMATGVARDIASWLETAHELQEKRRREDETRQRQLEADIDAERAARQQRRAGRSRSSSPSKVEMTLPIDRANLASLLTREPGRRSADQPTVSEPPKLVHTTKNRARRPATKKPTAQSIVPHMPPAQRANQPGTSLHPSPSRLGIDSDADRFARSSQARVPKAKPALPAKSAVTQTSLHGSHATVLDAGLGAGPRRNAPQMLLKRSVGPHGGVYHGFMPHLQMSSTKQDHRVEDTSRTAPATAHLPKLSTATRTVPKEGAMVSLSQGGDYSGTEMHSAPARQFQSHVPPRPSPGPRGSTKIPDAVDLIKSRATAGLATPIKMAKPLQLTRASSPTLHANSVSLLGSFRWIGRRARRPAPKVSLVHLDVYQGEEPADFVEKCGGTIVCRDDALTLDQGARLYSVRRYLTGHAIDQRRLHVSSLCAGHCFHLCTTTGRYVWQGRGSLPSEVQAALDFCPDAQLVRQDHEPESFWTELGGKGRYASASFWHLRATIPDPCPTLYTVSDSITKTKQFGHNLLAAGSDHVHVVDLLGGHEVYVLLRSDTARRSRHVMKALDLADSLGAVAGHTSGTPVKLVVCPGSRLPRDLQAVFRCEDPADASELRLFEVDVFRSCLR